MGIKLSAPGLDDAVAGTELKVAPAGATAEDIDDLKEEAQDTFESILNGYQKQTPGVYVKTSTLGSLEALLDFLKDEQIPVAAFGIGEVSGKDVKLASLQKQKGHPEYAVILAFDVKETHAATDEAKSEGVIIMNKSIIYNLTDEFKAYMQKFHESKKVEKKDAAVFWVVSSEWVLPFVYLPRTSSRSGVSLRSRRIRRQ